MHLCPGSAAVDSGAAHGSTTQPQMPCLPCRLLPQQPCTSALQVRVTPMRTEVIIRATRTQNVLGA